MESSGIFVKQKEGGIFPCFLGEFLVGYQVGKIKKLSYLHRLSDGKRKFFKIF